MASTARIDFRERALAASLKQCLAAREEAYTPDFRERALAASLKPVTPE